MPSWNIKNKFNDNAPESTVHSSGLHPALLELIYSRGIKESALDAFLYPDYQSGILDPFQFLEMPKIIDRFKQAIEKKEKVGIFGDYDADGITASLILNETFSNIGLENFVYLPDKRTEGYGLNFNAINYFKDLGVSLLVTADCGITSVEEVEKAKQKGIEVIVTDHHSIPEQVPEALAILNPKMENSGYPFKDLAGVGVAFKLAQALYLKFLPEKIEQLKWFLDLAATGTVADCVPLIGENRVIVKYGLVVLAKTRRVGFREIFNVGRICIDENNFPDARKVAFQIAPRINAAGRMDHCDIAYGLLAEKDQAKARILALEIEAKNQERQKTTSRIVDEVRLAAAGEYKNKKCIIAASEHYPIGVIGLAAGKIAEEFNRPTLILERFEKTSRGSLRSIPQVNIMNILKKCKDVLLKFGGHSQAAGLEVANEKLEELFGRFSAEIEKELEGKNIEPRLNVDLEITAEELDSDLAQSLRLLEPFGEGNREPVFAVRNFEVAEIKKVGNGEKHIKFYLKPFGKVPKIFEAISFNGASQFENIAMGDKIDIVFNLQIDEWNGNKKMVLRILDLKKNL